MAIVVPSPGVVGLLGSKECWFAPTMRSRSLHDLEQIDMIKKLESSEGLTVKAAKSRFDPMSIVLHWLTVLLIIGQFTTAWLHEAVGHGTSLALAILATHRAMGVLTWTVGLARLAWRRSFAYLPPFPESMPKLQQFIAKANEYGLYVLLLVQPVTGLGDVVFHGRPFTLFIWQVPALLAPDPAIRSLFQEAHEFGAKALLALIGLHAGVALFHGLVLRDGVLQRMLPLSVNISFLSARANAVRPLLGTFWNKITS
jgi:superoxide oxidase